MSFGIITQNQNMQKKQNCYMNTDSFIVYTKHEETCVNIVKNVERFNT